MSKPPTASGQSRSAIAKVTAVVEALAQDHSVSAISRRTGVAVSTVHRILQELHEVGWVSSDDQHGYVLGARLLSLAGQAGGGETVARVAHPILRQLSEQSGHAAHFALRSGDEAVYVDKVEGHRAYHMRSRIGLAIRLHCTAIGKVLLAHLPPDEVRAILARTGMPAMTEHTITDPERLLAHLQLVRERQWALDDEENESNIRCVAAPVIDHRGITIGALSVSGLAFEVDSDRMQQLLPLVRTAAHTVTASLGGPNTHSPQAAPPADGLTPTT